MSSHASILVRPTFAAVALVLCALLSDLAAAEVSARIKGSDPNSDAARADFARQLESQYELIAAGKFVLNYASLPADFYKQKPHTVLAEFRVVRGFKGAQPNDTVKIALSSDMLAAPGENISAGAKRDQLWADVDRRRAENNAALSALEQEQRAGQLAETEYARRLAELKQEGSRIGQESSKLSTVSGVKRGTDFQTFFERGGIVQSGYEYLIAVNRSEDVSLTRNVPEVVYALPSTTGAIFWSEQRDSIAAALHAVQAKR